MRGASLGAAVVLLALAGCGGSAAPRRHIHLTPFEQRGKTLFVGACGSCHTLADAGTSGMAGRELNSPWLAARVREVIADGPGGMPAGLFSGERAAEVAAYVAAATK